MDTTPPNSTLAMLYADIQTTCEKDWRTISAVFPNAHSVMQTFLNRIFAQSVQSTLEHVLNTAREHSLLYYLRTLAAAHAQTAQLLRELKLFDTASTAIVGDNAGHMHSTLSAAGAAVAHGLLSGALERALADLFVPYTEGERYIVLERRSLGERFDTIFGAFFAMVAARRHAAAAASNTSASARLRAAKEAAGPAPASPGAPNVEVTLQRLLETPPLEYKAKLKPYMLPEELTLLSLEIAQSVLTAHLEALRRAKEVSLPHELGKNVLLLFDTLVAYIGAKYIETGISLSLDDLTSLATPDGKAEPDHRCITVCMIATQIIGLVSLYVQHAVVPMLASVPNTQRELALKKSTLVEAVEGKIAAVLWKYIDSATTHLSHVLTKQKKTDYKPKDDGGPESYAMQTTLPCDQSCEFLTKVYNVVTTCFEPENAIHVIQEIGVAFHSALIEHYKKFQVNTPGGLLLTRDVTKYHNTISSFGIPALTDRFELLKQLSSLFIVKPENLKTVVNEGYLSRIEPALLHPFLQCRTDWGSLEKGLREFFAKASQNDGAGGARGVKRMSVTAGMQTPYQVRGAPR